MNTILNFATKLLSMTASMQQPVKDGDNGFALNGVTFQNPYSMDTCCDATFDRAKSTDQSFKYLAEDF